MLAIEEEFDIEFPEAMLTRRTFSSIAGIAGAVSENHARNGLIR